MGIFISYRRGDTRGSAGRLYDDLVDRFGADRVFRDLDAIEPGADYRDAIGRLIDTCEAMVVVIGDRWLAAADERGSRRLDDPADLVRQEIAAGLAGSKVVIPVLVEDALPPPAADLPPDLAELARRNALVLSDQRWRYDVDVLARRLEEVIGPRPPAAAVAPPGAAAAVTSAATAAAPPTAGTAPAAPDAATAPPAAGAASPDSAGFPARFRRGGGRQAPVKPWMLAAAAVAVTAVVAVVVAVVAGGGDRSAEEPAGPAGLGDPAGLAVDADGNVFVSDAQRNVVRRVGPDGTMSTVAGDGRSGSDGDGGPAVSAAVDTPGALAVDPAGAVYIAQGRVEGDLGGIRRVAPDGTISTVAVRSPGVARLIVTAMAIGTDGELLVGTAREVLRLNPDGTLTTLAGSAAAGFAGDGGPATAAKLDGVTGLAASDDGSIYVADAGNHRVRRVAGGVLATVAGTGSDNPSGDGGPAVEAGVPGPAGLAWSRGGLLVTSANQLRRIGPDGRIALVAGDPAGSGGFGGDGGPGPSALFSSIASVAVDPAGAIYVNDTGNKRVRRIGPDGTVSTVA